MVYSPNKVVACVKADGKILREDGNSVILPFGSEYSLLVKNLNSVRIQFKVSIDGTDATDGVWLVVQPNSDFELERFIRNGNIQAGNRFKFIERTDEIEEHRGIKADDGLIRIEYQVEKRPPKVEDVYIRRHYEDDPWEWPYHPSRPRPPIRFGGADLMRSSMKSTGLRSRMTKSSAPERGIRAASARGADPGLYKMSHNEFSDSITEQGITVPGSESNQSFRWTTSFETGPSEVIVLSLKGAVGGKKASKPLTVKTKLSCQTCGTSNKGVNKFCSKCGTALLPI